MPNCFHCKSTNIKKLSAIISQGTKEIDLGHGFLGIGASKNGMGIGGAKGKSKGTIKESLVTRMENLIPSQPSKFRLGLYTFLGFLLTIAAAVEANTVPDSDMGGVIIVGLVFLYFAYSARKNVKNIHLN